MGCDPACQVWGGGGGVFRVTLGQMGRNTLDSGGMTRGTDRGLRLGQKEKGLVINTLGNSRMARCTDRGLSLLRMDEYGVVSGRMMSF